MTPDEQIYGVLQVIDYVRAVSTSGVPVMIERSRFDPYPDHESVLVKLEWDFKAVTINKYPEISDVDYHASVGFYDDDILKEGISYKLDIEPAFDSVLDKFRTNAEGKTNDTHLLLSGTSLVLMLPDGEQLEIKKLRTDLGTFNFMQYLFAHQNTDIPISVIQTEVEGCQSRKDLTELVRNCGFDKTLKSYFFEGTTKHKVHFKSRASIPSDVVIKYRH